MDPLQAKLVVEATWERGLSEDDFYRKYRCDWLQSIPVLIAKLRRLTSLAKRVFRTVKDPLFVKLEGRSRLGDR